MKKKQYSTDFRNAVCQACAAGVSATEVARLFGVSRRTIVRWQGLTRETGSVAARPRSGRPRLLSAEEAAVAEQVLSHPDETLAEHAARWEREHGVALSPATLSRVLTRQQITRKKRHWWRASKTPMPGQPGRSSSDSWTPGR